MDAEIIRKLRSDEPFKPFRILLRDGRDLPVERPSFLVVSPAGGTVVYAAMKGGFEFVPTADIMDAVVDKKMRTIGRHAL